MLILPPQMCNLVPSVLRPIMTDDKLLCTQFYPTGFKLDVASGIKSIYSEAILPEIDEELLIGTVKKYEEKLLVEEKKRNTISFKPKMG
jgi:5'-3' exonuclease